MEWKWPDLAWLLQGREGECEGPCVLGEHHQHFGRNFLCFGSWGLSGSPGCRAGI